MASCIALQLIGHDSCRAGKRQPAAAWLVARLLLIQGGHEASVSDGDGQRRVMDADLMGLYKQIISNTC